MVRSPPDNTSYTNYTPPKGHPKCRLVRAKPFELAYLSWGHRWYGDAPAQPALHDGWHYFIVLDGNPILSVQDRMHRTRPGVVSICDPDCIVGHFDEKGRRCEMLTWVWRTPPEHPLLVPPAGDYLKLTIEAETIRRLRKLHWQCREAVARANDHSLLELRAARLQLDLCMLEGREYRQTANHQFRLDLAVEYLRNHLGEREPVKGLCEYLHVSEASLKRLFHARTGKSPRAFALDWRMQWAREQLGVRGASVKSVAYTLGYLHPNDFSRAFKRHHGINASDVHKTENAAGRGELVVLPSAGGDAAAQRASGDDGA